MSEKFQADLSGIFYHFLYFRQIFILVWNHLKHGNTIFPKFFNQLLDKYNRSFSINLLEIQSWLKFFGRKLFSCYSFLRSGMSFLSAWFCDSNIPLCLINSFVNYIYLHPENLSTVIQFLIISIVFKFLTRMNNRQTSLLFALYCLGDIQ